MLGSEHNHVVQRFYVVNDDNVGVVANRCDIFR